MCVWGVQCLSNTVPLSGYFMSERFHKELAAQVCFFSLATLRVIDVMCCHLWRSYCHLCIYGGHTAGSEGCAVVDAVMSFMAVMLRFMEVVLRFFELMLPYMDAILRCVVAMLTWMAAGSRVEARS